MSGDDTTILNLIRSDGYITVNKKLATAIGLNEAIVYGELVSRYFYFKEHNNLTDSGYFYNTAEGLEEATTLTKYQQTKSIATLKRHNLINMTVQGCPPKRYFKINTNADILLELFQLSRNLIIKSEVTLQSKVKKLDINNNKLIKQNNNTKSIVYSTHSSMGCFVFKILENQLRTCYKKINIAMTLDDVISIFEYFINKHKECCSFEHPNLTNDAVISILENVGTDYEVEGYYEMIDFYFTQNFIGNEKDYCDYSIKHFMSGDIRANCFYKTCY